MPKGAVLQVYTLESVAQLAGLLNRQWACLGVPTPASTWPPFVPGDLPGSLDVAAAVGCGSAWWGWGIPGAAVQHTCL